MPELLFFCYLPLTNGLRSTHFYQHSDIRAYAIIKLNIVTEFLVPFCFRVHDFEYTTECIIFDLLHISLYHGWLVDPQNQDEVQAVGKCSYNQLVEKIIGNKTSDKQEEVREGKIDKNI